MPLKAVSIVSPSIPDDRKCRVSVVIRFCSHQPPSPDTGTPGDTPHSITAAWSPLGRLIQTLCGEIKVKCDTIKQFVLSAVIVIITLLGITQSGASTMGKCCDITIVLSYLFH